jgi:hypothetical protein
MPVTASTDGVRAAIESEAKRVERETQVSALAHRMATGTWRLVYLALGVPTTALAAVAGASALADHSVLAAVFALAATAASALMNFMNPARQVADHLKASARYRAIENHARVLWEITCASEVTTESLRKGLDQIVDAWNEAIETSPPLFERFHRRARRQTPL